MNLSFRQATREDVPQIVTMLADDALGQTRETQSDPLPASYYDAFAAIAHDPNHLLIVATLDTEVVGTFQLSFMPYLTHRGSWRAQIEAVRVAAAQRGHGFGRQMFLWAIEQAKARGCRIIQLTTDKTRPEALKFYRSLGFEATHEGMKRHLSG